MHNVKKGCVNHFVTFVTVIPPKNTFCEIWGSVAMATTNKICHKIVISDDCFPRSSGINKGQYGEVSEKINFKKITV